MSKNTIQRIFAGAIMALIAGGAAVLEYFGFPAVRILGIIIVLMMIVEMVLCMKKTHFIDSLVVSKRYWYIL